MLPTTPRLALALSLFVALCGATPPWAHAEAVDPGATWAPPTEQSGGAQSEAPKEAATAEDESLSQGRRAQPPTMGQETDTAPQGQNKPKVAVVLLHQALGKPFDMSVINRIMEPLTPHVQFIALPLVKKAVARTRLPPSLIHLPKNLQRIGGTLGADFTLVVEAVGHGRNAGIFAGLVDVHSGETTVAKRVPMPTRTVTNSQAIVLVDLIVNALSQGAGAPQAAPEPQAAPSGAAADANLNAEGSDKGKAEASEANNQGSVVLADGKSESGPRKARLMIGLALNQRVAHLIDTQHSGPTPPQYAGSGNNSNPIFPGFQLDAEVYSGVATKHRRAWYDQFGVALHLTLAPVLSYTQSNAAASTAASITKLKSLVTKMDIYAMYRLLLLPHRALTPSLTLEVGLSRFAFPLVGAQFPGVAFTAPHIGLDFQMPVHKALLLRVGGGLRPAPTPGGESKTLLGSKSGGFGFTAGGGLIGSWRYLEAGLKVQFDRMAISYKGATNLYDTPTATGSTTPVQFTNIKLTDQLLQVLLTVGAAF